MTTQGYKSSNSTELSYREALRQAMIEEMDRDPDVFMLGQDIGIEGGMWEVTKGLLEKYGPDRVLDTPISESAILGAGLGAAMIGQRPIIEIMYNDFLPAGMDQLVNQIAKSRYMFGGQVTVPLVIRAPCGYGFGLAAAHSQSLEAWFTHLPGLYVSMPSSPAAAKGLFKSAVRDNNPVVFIEHCMLYNEVGYVPDDPDFLVPLGQAEVLLEGEDLTIVCWSLMVGRSLEAARLLATAGVSVEVIDIQCTSPLDMTTVMDSVKRTSRLLVAQQSCGQVSVGSEIITRVVESGLPLSSPPRRVSGRDIPIPFAENLERASVPSADEIVKVASSIMKIETVL